jgi:hypothetical protein
LDEVREAMADLFLDTEVRHDVPYVARLCVQAGLTIADARTIWCYEVAPVVGPNLFAVAGAWAGWDSGWLKERCARQRLVRQVPLVRELGYLPYRLAFHEMWRAIARCMADLLAVPPGERDERTRMLTELARLYFDMGGRRMAGMERLYPEPFTALLGSLARHTEPEKSHARVRAALADHTAPQGGGQADVEGRADV